MGARGCPQPKKEGFKTRVAALRKLRNIQQNTREGQAKVFLDVYRCRCKLWHVGHSRKVRGVRL